MAITNHRIVTGTQGGEAGISNVGTGADVTWPIAGNPSLTDTGLYYTSAEGASWANLTTPANRGTHYAWDAQGDGDDQPSWATGPGYVEIAPTSATPNTRVEFISGAIATAISGTASNLSDGFDVEFGLQFAINGTYAADTTPAHNAGSIAILEDDHAATSWQFRFVTRNVGGMAPGIVPAYGSYTGAEARASIVGGENSSYPMAGLAFNKWYRFRVRWKQASSSSANDGKVFVFINNQLVFTATGADTWASLSTRIGKLCALFYPYTSAVSTVKFRYCPPIRVRTVPDADVASTLTSCWDENTADNRDLRRHYPAAFANPSTDTTLKGGAWDVSGTVSTLPSVGTAYGSGGTFMGRRRFVVGGDAGDTFSIALSTNIWDGDSGDSPFGAAGYVHLSFNDIYMATSGVAQITIRDVATDAIHTISLDEANNDFYIDEVLVESGLAASHRWQIVLSMRPGSTTVILHDLTLDTKSSEMLRSYTVSNTWDGSDLGKPLIAVTFGDTEIVEVGGMSVFARNRFLEPDSFTSSAAFSSRSITISAVNTGTKTFTFDSADPGSIPIATQSMTISGSTGNNGTYTVVSSNPSARTVTVSQTVSSSTADGTATISDLPEYHCAAQRCGQYWNQSADFTVANGYDPCPLDGGFTGVDICMCLARSGAKLSESEDDFWDQLEACPDLHGILQCGTVNDVPQATASDNAALTTATEIADRNVSFARLCSGTGGSAIIIGSPPVKSGSMSGSYTDYAKKIPGLVNQLMEQKIQDARFAKGKVWWLNVMDWMPPDLDVVSSDGIHPTGSADFGDRKIVYYAHYAKTKLASRAGYNNDGSVKRLASGSSGLVGSIVGGGAW